jgi:archaellum biogenesis ATPase FlaH
VTADLYRGAFDLPDPEVLAAAQHQSAMDVLHEDKTTYPRFKRLESIHAMTGAFAPGEIVMLGAREGSGKSLLCQNLMDDLIEQEVPTLYIGTEQDADVLKIKHACMRAGVSPKWMLKPDPADIVSTAYQTALEAVQDQLKWLRSAPINQLALFANSEYVNQRELNGWINGGVKKYDIRCVIVDHIDQVQHGSGLNAVHEITSTIQLLHGLARRHAMPIVIASQLKRYVDPIKRFSPPEAADFAGTSGKERIASIMLGLWRPLRTDLDVKALRELLHNAKHGGTAEDRVYAENTMGVRLLKDRLGTAPGKQAMLYVGRGGRLEDDSAATHGIRTRDRDFGA